MTEINLFLNVFNSTIISPSETSSVARHRLSLSRFMQNQSLRVIIMLVTPAIDTDAIAILPYILVFRRSAETGNIGLQYIRRTKT